MQHYLVNMGFSDYFKLGGKGAVAAEDEAAQLNAAALEEIQKEIEVCPKDADDVSVCSGGSCENNDMERGEAVFAKLQIEHETPLLNTSKVPKVHFLVPTSKVDWAHDACLESADSVQYRISKWCESHADLFNAVGKDQGQTLTCSVTSQPIDIMDIDVMKHRKANVLVLPYFIWINDLHTDKVDETLDELVPLLINRTLSKEQLIEKYDNIEAARDKSYVFICSHTTRDKRCGVTAPYMKKVLDKLLQQHGLYRDNSDFRPDGCQAFFISHVGGHKFAGNVQIYLRDTQTLVWLGRVTPKYIPTVFEHLILPETPTLPVPEKVRCVKKYAKW